jgi:hypothetical protein
MKRAAILLSLFALLLVAAPSPQATPYEVTFCPIVGGRFLLDQGHLWIEILQQDHKPVQPRRERIANPLDDRSHEVLSTRGPVIVESHPDKKGGLFIHWGTLKDAKP